MTRALVPSLPRLTAFALALGVTACASTPAPVYGPGAAGPARSAGGPELPAPFALGPPEVVRLPQPLQCVPYARGRSGIDIFGDANTWWAQAAGRFPRVQQPSPGAVLVTRGYNTDARGHVAVVTAVISSREIRVDHANWLNGGEVSVRVPVLDVSPNNDWSQVRVWHIPGNHWGGRVYDVQGFILPGPMRYAQR